MHRRAPTLIAAALVMACRPASTGTQETGEVDSGSTACGNGVVDPGEVCDDANDQNSDGCNIDCLPSRETLWSVGDETSGLISKLALGDGVLYALGDRDSDAWVGAFTLDGEPMFEVDARTGVSGALAPTSIAVLGASAWVAGPNTNGDGLWLREVPSGGDLGTPIEVSATVSEVSAVELAVDPSNPGGGDSLVILMRASAAGEYVGLSLSGEEQWRYTVADTFFRGNLVGAVPGVFVSADGQGIHQVSAEGLNLAFPRETWSAGNLSANATGLVATGLDTALVNPDGDPVIWAVDFDGQNELLATWAGLGDRGEVIFQAMKLSDGGYALAGSTEVPDSSLWQHTVARLWQDGGELWEVRTPPAVFANDLVVGPDDHLFVAGERDSLLLRMTP